MAHLQRVSAVRWGHAVADDFFSKQLPNNVTWLLTLMYSLDQTGACSPPVTHGDVIKFQVWIMGLVSFQSRVSFR